MKIFLIILCALVSAAPATEPLEKLVRDGRFFPQLELVSMVQKHIGPGAVRQLTSEEYRAYRTNFGVFGLRVDYPPGDPDYVICDGLLIGVRFAGACVLPPLRALVGRKVCGVGLLAKRSELEARMGEPQHEQPATYAGRRCAKLDYYSGPSGTCVSFYVARQRVLAISITVEE
jgi:hypothetical protein